LFKHGLNGGKCHDGIEGITPLALPVSVGATQFIDFSGHDCYSNANGAERQAAFMAAARKDHAPAAFFD
jgi:hypothetical protein